MKKYLSAVPAYQSQHEPCMNNTEKANAKIRRGFTLIELLVIVAIFGVLAAVVLMTYPGAQKSARDGQRRLDLKQYQTALENYANQQSGLYPALGNVTASVELCNALLAKKAIPSCPGPQDPINAADSSFAYSYSSQSGVSGSAGYVLIAKLERTSGYYWVLCSDGRNGTKSVVDFVVSNGVCPL